MIDWTKPVQTRDGRKVRILCTDGTFEKYPVIGLIEGKHHPQVWMISGLFDATHSHEYDLVNVPAEMWVNVYEHASGAREVGAIGDSANYCRGTAGRVGYAYLGPHRLVKED